MYKSLETRAPLYLPGHMRYSSLTIVPGMSAVPKNKSVMSKGLVMNGHSQRVSVYLLPQTINSAGIQVLLSFSSVYL